MSLKVAVSGKGGVGKTTVAALLAEVYSRLGKQVLAVDADPDANLGSALGFEESVLDRLVAISELDDLIEERTGARPGTVGQWFTLNPKVDDIPEQFSVSRDGIRLIVMGGVRGGGAGCACPENAFLKSLLRHLVLERQETVIVDMEAGLEHLGRGTARGVDVFLVVVEPGRRSFQTARAVGRLAREIGVERVYAVGNKVRPGDEERVRHGVGDLPVLGTLPYDPALVQADLDGAPLSEVSGLLERVETIARALEDAVST